MFIFENLRYSSLYVLGFESILKCSNIYKKVFRVSLFFLLPFKIRRLMAFVFHIWISIHGLTFFVFFTSVHYDSRFC